MQLDTLLKFNQPALKYTNMSKSTLYRALPLSIDHKYENQLIIKINLTSALYSRQKKIVS